MRLWKINKRSSTLADMSMNRMLLTELIAKGALVGMIAGFCGATYRYLILESEHIRWQLMDGITMEWAIGWLIVMVIFAFIVDRLLAWAPLSGGSGIPQEQIEKAISMGVSKVNVNTEFQLSFAKATREYIEAGKDQEGKGFDPRKLLAPGKAAIIKDAEEHIDWFGSAGKA